LLLLLLDADVIIGLHKLGVWEQIVKNHKVHVPSIILHKEVYYYEDGKGMRNPINLSRDINKKIFEVSCSAKELIEFAKQFDRVFQEDLHDGEKEALVILRKHEEFKLCTCDHAPIKTLGLLDLSDQGISFENLLKKTGMNKKLEYKYTENRFRKCLSEGVTMRIQGRGLKSKSKK
jgi:hypothetical protein